MAIRLRRVRWAFTAVFAAVLAVTLLGFDSLGADCGDAIQADGSETFECNTAAYIVMASAFIAVAGLLSMLAWGAVAWFLTRRARAGR
jgi:hypothetical protein